MREGLSDRKLSKSVIDVEIGGYEAAVSFYQKNATPHLIILDTAAAGDDLIGEIDALAEVCDAGTHLLLLGELNDVQLYRDLIRRGVAEYLVKPVAPREIHDTITSIFVDPDAPPSGQIAAFYGSRGGVGSSTIAQNVAWHLANDAEEDVILIDLDLPFWTTALGFNIELSQGIQDALHDPDRLDSVLLERFYYEQSDKLKLLGSTNRLSGEDRVTTDGFERILDLARSTASFVVIDIPHLWTPWARQILLDADHTVISITPDLASLRDSRSIIDHLKAQRDDHAPIHTVLNKFGANKKSEFTIGDVEDALGSEPTTTLNYEPGLFGEASNNGQMLAEVNNRHKLIEALREFVMHLSGRSALRKKKRKKLGFLKV